MKSMNINLRNYQLDASTYQGIRDKLYRNGISYGSYGDGIQLDKDNVYVHTLQKFRGRSARLDYIKKNKIMHHAKIRSVLKGMGLDNNPLKYASNPKIRYTNTKWVAVVTVIPKVLLDINKQKVIQGKRTWKLVSR